MTTTEWNEIGESAQKKKWEINEMKIFQLKIERKRASKWIYECIKN